MAIRNESFFGLHFDFHAVPHAKGIGSKVNRENFAKWLDTVKPDFLEMDSKGHPGYTSYYSKHGSIAPGLVFDQLKVFSEECAKRGISLSVHHSGIFDILACKDHPEWAAVLPDGTIDEMHIDPSSEYADKKFIPQMIELGKDYGVTGVWIDGDCWAMVPSYTKHHMDEFYKRTGFKTVDEDITSESNIAFKQYWREIFLDYLRHIMTEIKKECPDMKLSSNGAFGSLMPQKVIEETDFLTFDASRQGREVRMLIRSFQRKGKHFEMNSWGMCDCVENKDFGFAPRAPKSENRLCREAAMAISFGGGYMVTYNMTEQGEIRMTELENTKILSDFVYARKEWNWQSVSTVNAAVLHSDYDCMRRTPDLLRYYDGAEEMCDIIIDGGRPVDVIYDYEILEDKINDRNTIVLPGTKYLSDELVNKLVEFVKSGGNLVACGPSACEMFADAANIKIDSIKKFVTCHVSGKNMYGIDDVAATFVDDGSPELCESYDTVMDRSGPRIKATALKDVGKGKIAFIGWDAFNDYYKYHRFSERDFMRSVLDILDPKPIAYLEDGIKRVEIIPATKDNKLLVNVINSTEIYYESQGNGFDEIPPIYDIVIAVKCEKEPNSVMLQPENITPEFTYDGEYIHVKIGKLDIHTIIVVE